MKQRRGEKRKEHSVSQASGGVKAAIAKWLRVWMLGSNVGFATGKTG